jgi:hypothetical protein
MPISLQEILREMLAQPQRIFALFAILFVLTGCKSEMSNPESMDPIFADLNKQLGSAMGKIESAKKDLEKAEKSIAKAEPRTIDIRNARSDAAVARATIRKFEQEVHYLKIRVDRRQAEDRLSYHLAFIEGKEWPDKDEYSLYQANRRLATSSRHWGERVPRLFELPEDRPGKKTGKEEKKEE